eukprot:COSAG02_NODE_49985_length_323_cov_0.928571_1_plen_23_part_10
MRGTLAATQSTTSTGVLYTDHTG